MPEPVYNIKDFVVMNNRSLQVVARVYNPYIKSWGYNLRSENQVYMQIPEVLIKNKN